MQTKQYQIIQDSELRNNNKTNTLQQVHIIKIKCSSRNRTHPLWSTSNILKAALKFDSGMLSNVTKKMYLLKTAHVYQK
jgi:hypothetical protein